MNTSHGEAKGDRENQLRRRAEEALRGNPVDLAGLPTEDVQYLLHELQVHQAELSLQNEELRRVQDDLEISRDLFANLYNFAPVGYCTLSEKGRILNANETLEVLLSVDQEQLLHHPFSDFVDPDDQDAYYLHRQRAFQSRQRQVSEIRLRKLTGERLVVRMESAIDRGNDTQIMVMLSDITNQRRLEAQQQENALHMILQRRLIEQSEMERVELARNLHDGPIQRLSGLGFSIQILKDIYKENREDGDGVLQQMGQEIKELIGELRGICNDLRPPLLTKFGLRRALQENVEDFQTKHPSFRITLEFSEDPMRLPETVALALYRIYQQAMSNILLHSKASEVWARIKIEPQQVLFEIQDNGQGFSSSTDWMEYARQGHLGLVGMKERAEAAGGKIELRSGPGEGTTIRVIVPLETSAGLMKF